MALSFFGETAAPKDFRVSETESESHYTKCPLCYTIRKNFHCVECIQSGNFQYSSLPDSDRFSEKHAKLLRVKLNKKHVEERCEVLLRSRGRKAALQSEIKQCRDRVELIKLAIEQRRAAAAARRAAAAAAAARAAELRGKLPRYERRVGELARRAGPARAQADALAAALAAAAAELAALRRARVRQLFQYIFPVYTSCDTSESIEDLEILHADEAGAAGAVVGTGAAGAVVGAGAAGAVVGAGAAGAEGAARERLHVVAAWLPADGDYSSIDSWEPAGSAAGAAGAGAGAAGARGAAALGLAAQLVARLAAVLGARLPAAGHVALTEFRSWSAARAAAWRVCGAAAGVCRAALRLPPPPAAGRAPLGALLLLARAAAADDPALGAAGPARAGSPEHEARWAAWLLRAAAAAAPDDVEPEHILWPEPDDGAEPAPPPPAPSLVQSAAATLSSLWRGWTK